MSLPARNHPGQASVSNNQPDCFEINRRVRRSGLSHVAQALLCAILDHDRYGKSRHGCTAANETLAGEIGASPRTVTRLLAALIADGWITMIRRSDSKFSPWRVLRMGPTCTGCTPRQGGLGVDLDRDGVHLVTEACAPRQGCPGKRPEETEKETEFAGGEDFAPPPGESGPRIIRFPAPPTAPPDTPPPAKVESPAPARPIAPGPVQAVRVPVAAGSAVRERTDHEAVARTLAGYGWLLRRDWTVVRHPGSSEQRDIPSRHQAEVDAGRALHVAVAGP